MRKHFNKSHPEKNFEDEMRIYEEQKHNLDQLEDSFKCTFVLYKEKDDLGRRIPKYCNKTFSNIMAKNNHMRFDHALEKRVKCQVSTCDQVFDRPCKVKTHMEESHPE